MSVDADFPSVLSPRLSKAKLWAIVPAAGVGARMGSDLPKQYLTMQGKTVIEHTLDRLLTLPTLEKVIVAIGKHDGIWQTLLSASSHRVLSTIGGRDRADSVLAGLNALKTLASDDDWVMVHDAARPCVRLPCLEKLIQKVVEHDCGGILAVPASDTLKQSSADNIVSCTIDRQEIWQAQTPQMFKVGQLREALAAALEGGYPVTDEASAIERAGLPVMLVEGRRDNIKITHPEDLPLAEFLLGQQCND
ncbi:2-C-methyl-D-erythritol 4-phosphate cytidylyltransferase [Marinibactrum halimedae]|uniref:2-C-methyl-D-erythritol 4-phosphate cytidylyltransferase n=1 Tax=Marinibactrum halimedae TaxID=1444977 RepID=A0AA37WLU9_9GAMM|nr:2-C-methyl-D-erythritol 4-phosphate cytidylyltransferase [Marinibactrum halimedae]MCD9458622.1 2-C-methyl-D-erythritol 4-phosphate cytidylyltransferase [Marinibactrum halimedae]GLS26013.1 2-C-methyl-D-erythritol 4-phosphate cytidylyltransferase [Marinibactrum halimedae]